MKARHVSQLWIILPLLALVAVLCIRWNHEQTSSQTTEPDEQEEVLPSEPPTEEVVPDVVQVCPDDTFPVVTVGTTSYLTDYSGQLPLNLPADTVVEITCGSAEGTYKLHTYGLSTYDEPDVILESCSDMFCTGAYSLVMLERV